MPLKLGDRISQSGESLAGSSQAAVIPHRSGKPKGDKFDHLDVVSCIQEEKTIFYSERDGCVMEYDEAKGFFKKHSNLSTERLADDAIRRCGWVPNRNRRREVIEELVVEAVEPPGFGTHEGLLNFQTGMVRIRDGELLPHDPKYLSVFQIPCPWNPSIECPKFMDFVKFGVQFGKNGTKEDLARLAMIGEMIGYFLLNKNPIQVIHLIFGRSRNGKSVLCLTITNLIGPSRTVSIPLHRLGEKFASSQLLDAILCICPEASRTSPESDQFINEISGRDPVQIERKYRDPITTRLETHFLFVGNERPRFFAKSGSTHRRIIMPPWTAPTLAPDRRNPNLEDEFRKELPGIAAWALGNLHRVLLNGEFTVSKTSQAMLEDFEEYCNPALEFVRNQCDFGDEHEVLSRDLYSVYRRGVEEDGGRPLSNKKFTQFLKDRFGVSDRHVRSGTSLTGIRLRPMDIGGLGS